MTTDQKNSIKQLVIESIEHLGGQRATATKVGVSAATISQIVNDKWSLIADDMWRKIGAALGVNQNGWQLVDNIFNTRILKTIFIDAKKHSMMMCVSHKAGSGKTAGSNMFYSENKRKHVYLIRCREWGLKVFLSELCKNLGIEKPRGYVGADTLLSEITDFFLLRAEHKPLLIIDEADKLRPAALRTLIPLFNSTEDRLGVVILGTDNLSVEIKRGVRYNKKGFDEIDSRLGRQFVSLYGATKQDAVAICKANGIDNKDTQNTIWNECQPKEVSVGGKFKKMIDDLRRLKRVIQRELIHATIS